MADAEREGEATRVLIQVLVADDNDLLRATIGRVVGAEPDMHVVGLARDGREAVDLATSTRPDVVVMDVRMPVLDGVSATREIRSRHPLVRVLMLTAVMHRSTLRAALAAGASGYLLKDGDEVALTTAVRDCASGGRPVAAGLS
jgi:DNA-binding NarL/FixJ family response regulator